MSAADKLLTAEEIVKARSYIDDHAEGTYCTLPVRIAKGLCTAAESLAAKDAEIARLRPLIVGLERTQGSRLKEQELRIEGQLIVLNEKQAEIAELRARVERAEADAWIPVGERLPEVGVRVMVWNTEDEDECAGQQFAHIKARTWWVLDPSPHDDEYDAVQLYQLTHWRPLPASPAASQPKPEGGADG